MWFTHWWLGLLRAVPARTVTFTASCCPVSLHLRDVCERTCSRVREIKCNWQETWSLPLQLLGKANMNTCTPPKATCEGNPIWEKTLNGKLFRFYLKRNPFLRISSRPTLWTIITSASAESLTCRAAGRIRWECTQKAFALCPICSKGSTNYHHRYCQESCCVTLGDQLSQFAQGCGVSWNAGFSALKLGQTRANQDG